MTFYHCWPTPKIYTIAPFPLERILPTLMLCNILIARQK